MSAGVVVGDEAIHRRRDRHADAEPGDHQHEARDIEPARLAHAPVYLALTPELRHEAGASFERYGRGEGGQA